MKVLFITSHRLGDAVISTAVLRGLMARYPAARFTVVCGPAVASLFEGFPAVREIIPWQKKPWKGHWLELWRKSCLRRWFMVADLRGSPLPWFLWSRYRISFRGRKKAPVLRVHAQLETFHLSGDILPEIPLKEEAGAGSFPGPGVFGKRRIALAPTAGSGLKRWPAACFSGLIAALERRGFQPVLFYGPGEDEVRQMRELLDRHPRAERAGGCMSLQDTGRRLKECMFFVGNDSGLMHLSAALGVPTLGLFGPTLSALYAPQGKSAHVMLAGREDGEGRMDALAPQKVLEKVLFLVSETDLKEEAHAV